MTTGNNILLILQDTTYTEQLVPTLQAAGYGVHTAAQMRDALTLLAEHQVRLIVCDNALEDVSGLDFLTFLKKDPLRENIPFMFLVSIENQGRPFKAFELGAVDYLVYPLDAHVVVDRVGEYCPLEAPMPTQEDQAPQTDELPADVPEQQEQPPAPSQPPAVSPAPSVRLTPIDVEVSRDGVIWMPSKITDFGPKNLMMQTSLFGKQGVSLIIRFKRPEGLFVIYGRINEIVFNDFQQPADIDAAVEESEAWQHILDWLNHLRDSAATTATPDLEEEDAEALLEPTIAMTDPGTGSSDISAEELYQKAEEKKKSYDIRFYNSIIGKQLDNYRVISLIAAGNMGGVLQGWDVALEREVALKIISFELSSKEQFRDMFIKEARLVSKLNHTNIAQIYSIGCSNDILYYAMEFIDGQTLRDLMKSQGTLNLLKGIFILSSVCKGLEVVYHHGVVHRDIKPANIMIAKTGDVKIVDFGVAHNKENKSKDKNRIVGTPLYMSPEQIVGLTLDHRSDMYSLGASFYHAFSGGPPFGGENVSEMLDQHLNVSPMPLEDRNPKVPSALSKIIEKMMAKDPTHRYQTFKQIADELQMLRSHLITANNRSAKAK